MRPPAAEGSRWRPEGKAPAPHRTWPRHAAEIQRERDIRGQEREEEEEGERKRDRESEREIFEVNIGDGVISTFTAVFRTTPLEHSKGSY